MSIQTWLRRPVLSAALLGAALVLMVVLMAVFAGRCIFRWTFAHLSCNTDLTLETGATMTTKAVEANKEREGSTALQRLVRCLILAGLLGVTLVLAAVLIFVFADLARHATLWLVG